MTTATVEVADIADFEPVDLADATSPPRRRGRPRKGEGAGVLAPPSPRGSHWSETDLAVVRGALTLLIITATGVMATQFHDETLRFIDTEAEAITSPAVSILTRHIKVPKARQGDLADCVAILTAFSAYSARVYSTHKAAKEIDKNSPMNQYINSPMGPLN